MNYVRVKSYAKINLTLDVLGVKDGYHMIDSVVASIDLSDVITVKKRKDNLISIAMHGEGSENIPYESNNAVKAGERFVERFQTNGADITVWKNIPQGAGLGGSSADVSGVLRAMAKLYKIDDMQGVKEIADSIGSDCGYMLTGGFARISGRGEKVKLIEGKPRLSIGLLLPEEGVSTAECYRLSDSLEKSPFTSELAQEAIEQEDVEKLGLSLSNGLLSSAKRLNGRIATAYNELKEFDPLGVNMTGSGSGVYAVFENDEFARYAKSRYLGKCRFVLTKTVTPLREEE
ncbi:MAG: 4-(cytidine 5'-diphospho)-2-C-methyl-D-erythritol kinase [Candidatus Coproplasma sp.]